MENIKKYFRSPDGADSVGGKIEKNEKLGELAYYPIFRGNTLYNEMFPDIQSLFQAGEEPNAKVILQEILKHKGEQIVMDNTTDACFRRELTQDDLLEVTPGIDIVLTKYDKSLDVMSSLEPIFKKNGITFSRETIDRLVSGSEYEDIFNSGDAKQIVSLIKNQVPNVNRIIVGVNNIDDHITNSKTELTMEAWKKVIDDRQTQEFFKEIEPFLVNYKKLEHKEETLKKERFPKNLEDFILKTVPGDDKGFIKLKELISELPASTQDEISKTLMRNYWQIRTCKESILIVLSMLNKEIKNTLGIDPEFTLGDIELSSIDENTAIVYDHHNKNIIMDVNPEEEIPQQAILMPISAGMNHAQKIGALKSVDGDFALSKRRLFEKKEEKE